MLRRLLQRFRAGAEVVHECRNCGTTIEDVDSDCPSCGGDEVATYKINEGQS